MAKFLLTWEELAWEQYLYWIQTDKKVAKKINNLLKEIKRTPHEGTGKPEPLTGNLSGYWSRRITQEHRLVYRVNKTQVIVAQCRYYYNK